MFIINKIKIAREVYWIISFSRSVWRVQSRSSDQTTETATHRQMNQNSPIHETVRAHKIRIKPIGKSSGRQIHELDPLPQLAKYTCNALSMPHVKINASLSCLSAHGPQKAIKTKCYSWIQLNTSWMKLLYGNYKK